jgi:hypothetical protein
MNPYLEQPDAWSDFHERLLTTAANVLDAQVGEEYFVKVDQNVYAREAATGGLELIGRPDVYLALSQTPAPATAQAAPAASRGITPASAHVMLAEELAEEEAFLEIRDRRSREIVTVIELLSPTNKQPGERRDQFLAKRRRVLASTANYVEIDLLRGYPRLPLRGLPVCDYYAMVSRPETRPRAELWSIGLGESLPNLPVPLRGAAPDVSLDLQALLHQVYDAGGYRKYIYEGEPEPPLAPADAEWARSLVAAAR